METAKFIMEILGLVGLGAIIGSTIQYFITKKLFRYEKILETKLIIFRGVYKQLYYLILWHEEDAQELEKGTGINIDKACAVSGLDLRKDLGDILFYVDGELESMVGNLIYTIYKNCAVVNKEDFELMRKIMTELKKII